MVIENIFNGDETQITSVKNLEYNTAYIYQKNISEDEKQVLLVKRRKILTRNLSLLENIPRYSNN